MSREQTIQQDLLDDFLNFAKVRRLKLEPTSLNQLVRQALGFFQAKANGIGVVPGLIFSTRDKFQSFVRLTCSGVWTRETEKGIETLGDLAVSMVSARTD